MSQAKIPSKTAVVQSNTATQNEEFKDDDVSYFNVPEQPEDECDSSHLLNRKTESFRCLQQILLSSSAFMRNKDFRFPPLHDPGIHEAFHYVEPEPIYDDVGVEKYILLCKDLNIVPISRIIKSLPENIMNLKYYGLTSKQMQALTETLKINAHITKLILQDNWLSPDVTEMLCNMLEENTSIRILNLKECRIGEEGAIRLSEALSSSQFLTELDLSFNSLGDRGLSNLQVGLCEAPNLTVLNLSHNNLTEESVETLEKILLENKIIQELDLSWNLFCTSPGNKKLFNAMKESDTLRVLNIAWNGICQKPAVVPIANYLKKAEHLEYLDISNNKPEAVALRSIRTGILKNHSLKCVRMGNNISSTEDAYYFASVLTLKEQDPLEHLDLENTVFDKRVLQLSTKLKKMGKTMNYGNVIGNFTIKGPDEIKLIFQRCKYILDKPKKKKLKKDFGHFVLALPDGNLPKEQFLILLKKKKIKKLDNDLLKNLCIRFAARGLCVDCVKMKEAYLKYFPDTCLPPPPPKKQKKGKKGKKGKGKEKQAEEPTPQDDTNAPPPPEGQDLPTTENENKCAVPTEVGTTEEIPVEPTTEIQTNTTESVPEPVSVAEESEPVDNP